MRIGDVRRILVLNRNCIGDCLLTTPMLRALKRRFPRAQLSVAIPERNKELLVTNPHVDEIVIRPPKRMVGAKIAFAIEMRRRGFDLIISLQEKSLFYAWASRYATLANPRRPVTISLDHARTRRYYQYYSPIRPNQHEVHKYLDIATMLGCPRERNPVLELEPTSQARDRMDLFLNNHEIGPDVRFVGINAGGTKPDKRWPEERFAAVGDRVHDELGLPVLIFGGPEDKDMTSRIAERMRHKPLVAAGRSTLADTASLLERCELLITGDTGPMHMAVAMAVPVVALFGPTNPQKFGPFTSLKTILRHDHGCPVCPGAPCLHTIQVDEVVKAALGLYNAPPSRRVQSDSW